MQIRQCYRSWTLTSVFVNSHLHCSQHQLLQAFCVHVCAYLCALKYYEYICSDALFLIPLYFTARKDHVVYFVRKSGFTSNGVLPLTSCYRSGDFMLSSHRPPGPNGSAPLLLPLASPLKIVWWLKTAAPNMEPWVRTSARKGLEVRVEVRAGGTLVSLCVCVCLSVQTKQTNQQKTKTKLVWYVAFVNFAINFKDLKKTTSR